MEALTAGFAKEMLAALQFIPVWPLGTPVAVGDIVTFKSGMLQTGMGRLEGLGTPVRTIAGALQYASAGAVSVSAGAQANVEGANVGVKVSFGKEGSTFLSLAGSYSFQLPDLTLVDQQLEAKIASAEGWNRKQLVVSEVIMAEAALLLIARKSGASVVLDFDPTAAVPLAAANVEMRQSDGSIFSVKMPVQKGKVAFPVGIRAFRKTRSFLGLGGTLKAEHADAEAERLSTFGSFDDLCF